MRDKTKYCFGIAIAIISIFGTIVGTSMLLSSSTHAINNAVANKAMAYGVYECYKDGNIINKVSLTDYDGLSSITDFGNNIILPTGYYDIASVNCGWLIGGNPMNNFSGAAAINGISIPENNGNTSAVSTFMKGMGYSEKKADGGKCVSYTYYSIDDPSTTKVTKMCAAVNEDGKITSDRVEVSGDNYTCMQIEIEDKAIKLDCNQLAGFDGGCGRHSFEPGVTDFDTFAGGILGDLEEHHSTALFGAWTLNKSLNIESRGDVLATFEFRDRSDAGVKAIKYLTGYNSLSATKLTETEKISLLQDYLKNYYKIDNYGCNLDSSQQNIAKGAGYTAINTNMFSGSGYQTCWIKPTENVGSSVASYNSQGYFDGTPMTYDQIIEALGGTVTDLFEADKQKCNDAAEQQRRAAQQLLNQSTTSEEYRKKAQQTIDELDKILRDHGEYWHEENGAIVCYPFTDVSGQVVTPPTDSTTPPSGSDSDGNGPENSSTDIDQCFDSAGALGWILCPVISFVSSATDSIYNDYIQSEFLEVKAENISTGSDLYKSWQAIRNIANILFIIMFVLVVLSQITGLGISNYGIKKILPRLIIVAVLVNISFLLCQFAVDLSNILGYSLNDIFVKLSPDVDKGMGTLGNVGSGIASALTWGGIALLAINTAGAWLIPLLLALLTGIISVIFGGIILGLRQAGIIVLVVLAPVAIVCYALPNAKNFFDRWLKMFISLLMVFPICGALMGGGFFASNLIVNSTDSVLLSIIAMLIRVAPFFMIPSLVRTSLMAIGNIGNKVANWGNKMGRTATGAIAKSDFVRQRDADLAKFQGDTTALRGRMLNRVLRKDPSKLSDRRKAKVARQYAKYNKLRGEEATAFPYAMSPGSREYTAAQNAAHQKRISTLADNIAAENIDVATDAEELEKRLDQAMVDYNSSGSDEDLASLQAFNNMLISNGDNGISAIQNSLGRANEAGLDRSVQALGQHLINSHTKDIKPVARELFGAAGAAAAGELRQGMFTEDKDGMYTSLSHLKSSVGGYDASSIGKMNETSLQRMINNSSELKKDEKFVKTFDLLSSNSLTNPNIHVQPKVAEKMNKLRSELGLTQIENNSDISPNSGGSSSSSDSGRIQIQGNNDNGNGTIVQTGNDGRSRRPLPSAVREGNNYRQNDSGIWLPPNHN